MIHSQGFLTDLLEKKNLSDEERRRLVVASAALDLIAIALSSQGGSHKLSEELQSLPRYIETIETAIRREAK